MTDDTSTADHCCAYAVTGSLLDVTNDACWLAATAAQFSENHRHCRAGLSANGSVLNALLGIRCSALQTRRLGQIERLRQTLTD